MQLAVDTIIRYKGGIVLIKRKDSGEWAIPGGMVEEDESCEAAAKREMKEETGLDIRLVRQFHTYSDPKRDPRGRFVTVVFIAEGNGTLMPDDDAVDANVFSLDELPKLAFDHRKILMDYHNGEY